MRFGLGLRIGKKNLTGGQLLGPELIDPVGWVLTYGGAMVDGVNVVYGTGALNASGSNHSIYQRIFEVGVTKSYRISFDALVVSGSDNLQAACGFGIHFDQSVTGTMQRYVFDVIDYNPAAGWAEGLAYGGLSGEFNVDNVSVREIL